MGDVTRIQTIDNSNAGKLISNDVCSGCLGNEVLATDTKFCSNPQNNGNIDRNFRCADAFGPCSEVKVYRYVLMCEIVYMFFIIIVVIMITIFIIMIYLPLKHRCVMFKGSTNGAPNPRRIQGKPTP